MPQIWSPSRPIISCTEYFLKHFQQFSPSFKTANYNLQLKFQVKCAIIREYLKTERENFLICEVFFWKKYMPKSQSDPSESDFTPVLHRGHWLFWINQVEMQFWWKWWLHERAKVSTPIEIESRQIEHVDFDSTVIIGREVIDSSLRPHKSLKMNNISYYYFVSYPM